MNISADYISNVSQDPIIKLAKGIVFSLLDHKQYKLVLFGSRATGIKLKESSDYDFGIIGQDKLPYSQYMMLQ
jgi:predicted nucleotidyltransferase